MWVVKPMYCIEMVSSGRLRARLLVSVLPSVSAGTVRDMRLWAGQIGDGTLPYGYGAIDASCVTVRDQKPQHFAYPLTVAKS